MADNNEIMTIQENDGALMDLDYDNILALANHAEKIISAMNTIMSAALKITTPKDWVLIGGAPYLQEAGASKIARAFGISWKICDGYPKTELNRDGYPTYTYRMEFMLGKQKIEAEGMRSANDEFFIGKSTDKDGNPKKQKSVDEVDLADVKRAAYTNCLNRGIKGILPGLRNLDVSDLEEAGINLNKTTGYTFKQGTKGGSTGKAEESGLVCSDCGKAISQKVASYSEGKYGRALCMSCQKKAEIAQREDPIPVPPEVDSFAGGEFNA